MIQLIDYIGKGPCTFCMGHEKVDKAFETIATYKREKTRKSTIFPVCDFCFDSLMESTIGYLNQEQTANITKRYHKLSDSYEEYKRFHDEHSGD